MRTGYLKRCQISHAANSSHSWLVDIEWWTKAQDGSLSSLHHANPDPTKAAAAMIKVVRKHFRTKEEAAACVAENLAETVEIE